MLFIRFCYDFFIFSIEMLKKLSVLIFIQKLPSDHMTFDKFLVTLNIYRY